MSDTIKAFPTAPSPYSATQNTFQTDPTPYGFVHPHPPPQQSYPPPYSQGYPQGHQLPPGYVPSPQTTQPAPIQQQTVVVMGGCPSCRVGVLEDDYTCCGILCAICFFPLGILCCLAMKEKRCTNCKASF